MAEKQIRVRYAPSPTGLQHIGGIRTALFNFFFAKANHGKFILRVEDTDRQRSEAKYLADLYSTLEWLGLDWDEGPLQGGSYGPYLQSERQKIYRKYALQLLESKHAYPCFCSSKRLADLREEQKKAKQDFGYDRHCRNLETAEQQARMAAGEAWVLRFRVPLEGTTSFDDLLLGTISRKNSDISPDPVLLKSDGFPTYHLANVVDDHLMEISHILRAQEWLASCPLHKLLYQAFAWEAPKYCHLPMVIGKDRAKLSKRHGASAVMDFKNSGYLPAAIINYISLLGWAWDDKTEFFSAEKLQNIFTLEKLTKSPSIFDYDKLAWFNGQYIRKVPAAELGKLILPYMQEAGLLESGDIEQVLRILPLIKERLTLLRDAVAISRYLFRAPRGYDPHLAIPKKLQLADMPRILKALAELLPQVQEDREQNESLFKNKAQELGIKLGMLMQPLRIAITGAKVSPPLFESISIIGLEEAGQRLNYLSSLVRENTAD